MVNYPSFEGKVIKMNHAYPICDENDNPIGYTKIGDMAVITLADVNEEGYFETVIVSGEFIGIDTLALNLRDIMNSTFIFNKLDNNGDVSIDGEDVIYEYR